VKVFELPEAVSKKSVAVSKLCCFYAYSPDQLIRSIRVD
jgi:hypothetical protein